MEAGRREHPGVAGELLGVLLGRGGGRAAACRCAAQRLLLGGFLCGVLGGGSLEDRARGPERLTWVTSRPSREADDRLATYQPLLVSTRCAWCRLQEMAWPGCGGADGGDEECGTADEAGRGDAGNAAWSPLGAAAAGSSHRGGHLGCGLAGAVLLSTVRRHAQGPSSGGGHEGPSRNRPTAR